MEFKTIQEKTKYYLSKATSDKGADIYRSLSNIEYVEDKVKYVNILDKEILNWVDKNIPELSGFSRVTTYNLFNGYSVKEVLTAKRLSKEKLSKIKSSNNIIEFYETEKFNDAINKVSEYQNNEYSRENIHVYKTSNVDLVENMKEVMESRKDEVKGKLILMVYVPKDININVSDEHNKIYKRAKKLGLPKEVQSSYGNISTYDFFKQNLKTFDKLVYFDNNDVENVDNNNFVIKEKRIKMVEKAMFDNPHKRILSDIRSKKYDLLEKTLILCYKDKDGYFVKDNSKIRLLCLLYMLEDSGFV